MPEVNPVALSLVVLGQHLATVEDDRVDLWSGSFDELEGLRSLGQVGTFETEEAEGWRREVGFLVRGQAVLLVPVGQDLSAGENAIQVPLEPSRAASMPPAAQWASASIQIKASLRAGFARDEHVDFDSPYRPGMHFVAVWGRTRDGDPLLTVKQNSDRQVDVWSRVPERDGWVSMTSTVTEESLTAATDLLVSAMRGVGLGPLDVFTSFRSASHDGE